jgi:DNA-directed RNA polymerase specialized sigma24 family protein
MDSDSALAYLYTLIRRKVLDRVRRKNAGRRFADQTAVPMYKAARTPAGPESNPERRFMVREARRQLRRALARVASGRHPTRERLVFELATLNVWPSPEIGDAVRPRMSPGAVDVAVCRTRRKLEERFFDEIGILMRRGR